MKRVLKIFVLIFVLLILFRAPLFRSFVKYEAFEVIPLIELKDKRILNNIRNDFDKAKLSCDYIFKYSLKFTKSRLKFTKHVSFDPNVTAMSKKADCVGYAALFNSVGNFLIKKHEMTNELKILHLRGELFFFGKNIHTHLKNPFFKDHDFNAVIYKKTGDTVYTDPSLSDYFFIDRVQSKEE